MKSPRMSQASAGWCERTETQCPWRDVALAGVGADLADHQGRLWIYTWVRVMKWRLTS